MDNSLVSIYVPHYEENAFLLLLLDPIPLFDQVTVLSSKEITLRNCWLSQLD